MKKIHVPLLLLALFCLNAHAQTVFDDGDATDSYIENALNWDNGAPSAVNPGMISINAKVGLGTITDWVVTQTAGSITQGSYPNLSLSMSGGSWTMNGGSFSQRAHTYSAGAVFTLNNGSITTVNNSVITVDASQMIVNGGTVTADRGVRTVGGGNFTMNGGTVNSDTADAFGPSGFAGNGTMNLNGGTLTAGRITFQSSSDSATLGGSTSGTASFINWGNNDSSDRQNDNNIEINFLQGSQMTLAMGSGTRALVLGSVEQTDAWAEALWNTNQLLFNGVSSTGLGGLTWSDATNSSVGLGNGEYFSFTPEGSFGGSLSLAVIPEPSTLALVGIALLSALALKRRAS